MILIITTNKTTKWNENKEELTNTIYDSNNSITIRII